MESKACTTLAILVIWQSKNMYDMKPKTYHSMYQIEQVSVSSTLAQTKGHGRVHENIR